MRIILAAILLLNSYVAIGASTSIDDLAELEILLKTEPETFVEGPSNCGEQLRNSRNRGPAAAPRCQTAQQLISSNISGREFTNICRVIVEQDEGCKKLQPDKRMDCRARANNIGFSGDQLVSKIGQCVKGATWDVAKGYWDLGVSIVNLFVESGQRTFSGMYKFFTDSEYRERSWAAAKRNANAGSRLGMAFLRSAAQYFVREYPRNLARTFNPVLAAGATIATPIVKMLSEALQAIAAHYIPQLQCMNGPAKVNAMCRVAGEFLMPPAFVLAYLKYGARGLTALARSKGAVLSRVKGRFSQMFEVRAAARRVEPPQSNPAIRVAATPPRPARPPRPAPAVTSARTRQTPSRPAPLPPPKRLEELPNKPIEEHSPEELFDLARAERAETAALNEAEAARIAAAQVDEVAPAQAAATSADEAADALLETREYKTVLTGLAGAEKTEAANAIEALSKSGASPGIVVGLFRKYAPHFRAEVARTPAGTENLWSKLGRYVKKEKQAGKSDEAIQRQIDEAFKCK